MTCNQCANIVNYIPYAGGLCYTCHALEKITKELEGIKQDIYKTLTIKPKMRVRCKQFGSGITGSCSGIFIILKVADRSYNVPVVTLTQIHYEFGDRVKHDDGRIGTVVCGHKVWPDSNYIFYDGGSSSVRVPFNEFTLLEG